MDARRTRSVVESDLGVAIGAGADLRARGERCAARSARPSAPRRAFSETCPAPSRACRGGALGRGELAAPEVNQERCETKVILLIMKPPVLRSFDVLVRTNSGPGLFTEYRHLRMRASKKSYRPMPREQTSASTPPKTTAITRALAEAPDQLGRGILIDAGAVA